MSDFEDIFVGLSQSTEEAATEETTESSTQEVLRKFQQQDFTIDDDTVKTHLDEILLTLIAAREGANGKQLIKDIDNIFGTFLSSGTLYPALHSLHDDGVLTMHKHIQTKEYRLNENQDAVEALTDTIEQDIIVASLLVSLRSEITE